MGPGSSPALSGESPSGATRCALRQARAKGRATRLSAGKQRTRGVFRKACNIFRTMDFAEVVKSAEEVLEEERRHPTAHYTFNASDERGLGDAMVRMLDVQQLGRERTVRPREIKEKSSWVFQSTNYSLLVALLSQLRPEQRPGFMSALLSRFRHGSESHPSYRSYSNLQYETAQPRNFFGR